ncbi:sensor histidine kinase [Knoellia subterranea]|uniref:histidine kinase n=1 Tax=Knoellia subterranea KCTC 19937 TaxID=1385521 RepID=A0A0A0JI94_9MICO|nr:histidine kinase [Knoellia subterranea]KGN36843.1 hypothetical protein N803_17370 [Knoellia subterranea KCTC 19937]
MTPYPVLAALTAVGLSLLCGGTALLVKGATRNAAGCLVAAGLGCLIGTVLDSRDRSDAAVGLWIVSAGLLLLGVVLYPRWTWRNPADFIAATTVMGATALGALQSHNDTALGSLGIATVTVLIAHTWWRIEHAREQDRRALVWVALVGGAVALASGFLLFLSPTPAGAAAGTLLWTLLAPSMYVGVALPDIIDVRTLVVRVVVFVVAGIVYLSALVLVSSFLEILGGTPPAIGVLATVGAIAALGLHPLQGALRGVFDHLLFGPRPDPLTAATHLATRPWTDSTQALDAVRAELALPYLSLVVPAAGEVTSGEPADETRSLSLEGANFVVGLRPGDVAVPAPDQQVLRLVAPVFVQLLRAEALAEDLRESRAQSVRALEDERRRLRRDLHDGLGPRLSGIAMTADAASNTVRSDPSSSEALLRTLRAETTSAISEVRQLVYAMRPPALDELGLVGAVRQQVNTLRARDGTHLAVTTAAAQLPPLSAAAEVAAYRIIVEALTNVARHSDSTSATVTLRCEDDVLVVEVTDTGSPNSEWVPGVGLTSMHERAAEMGGQVSAQPTPQGGRVHAELPHSFVSRRA